MTRSERRAFRAAHAAWLFGIFAFFMPAATWSPFSRLSLTRAVVEHRTFSIDAYATGTGDRSRANARWYSDKAPIPSLLAVPAYAAVYAVQQLRGVRPEYRAISTARTPAIRVHVNSALQQALYACSVVTSGLSGVAVGLLLFELLRRRVTSHAAFVGSSLVTLGTPLFPYATSFYGHVPAGAFLLGALLALDPRDIHARKTPLSRTRFRVAGACLALAPGCEYLTALPVAAIGAWFLLRTPGAGRLRVAVDLALGAAVPVALVAGYHTLAFGAPWRTGYSFIVHAEFAAGHATGFLGIGAIKGEALLGLTFGARRGLFYLSPLALVALLATVFHAIKRRDWSAKAGLLALGLLLVLNASYYMWWGGASAGPRHLVPALAVLAVGLGVAWRKSRWLRAFASALGVVSIANCLAIAAVGVEAPDTGDVLRDFAWRRLLEGRVAAMSGASNIGLKLGLKGIASLLPLLFWGCLGYWYLIGQTRRGRRRRSFARNSR